MRAKLQRHSTRHHHYLAFPWFIIAADPDEASTVIDWYRVTVELPKPKADLHMRVDHDVLDFFRKTRNGYQSRINAVLRSYVARTRCHNRHPGRGHLMSQPPLASKRPRKVRA